MNNIFVISDTHWSHSNILKFKHQNSDDLIRPGFSSIEEMDETMINNWNNVVKPTDKIYHLGDVTMSQKALDKIMPRLNGKKRLIMGNHDKCNIQSYAKYFEKISSWRSFGEFDIPFVMCHYPLHRGSFEYRKGNPGFCVHGHIHEKIIPEHQYINVCVEKIEYTPISIDELLKTMKGRLSRNGF